MSSNLDGLKRSQPFRWVVLLLLVVTQLFIQLNLYGPAAAAALIRQHLGISNAQFGFAMGTANIATTVVVILSSLLVDLLGTKRTFAIGLAVLGAGGSVMALATKFPVFLMGRVAEGLGIGIIYPVAAALIMAWFSTRELTYATTIFLIFAFVGSGMAYITTARLLKSGSSWTTSLSLYGFGSLAVCAIWSLSARRNPGESNNVSQQTERAPIGNSLRKAIRMPVIWLLGIGLFAARSVAEMYLFFLPLYLQKEGNFEQVQAANLASLLPFASVLGVVLFGLLTRKIAFRKPLLWISATVVLFGSILVAFAAPGGLKWGLIMIGCGVAGLQPVQSVYVMSLPGVTPSIVAAFFVITNLLTHMGGFLSPIAAGKLSETSLGLKYSLFVFSLIEIAGLLALLAVPSPNEGKPIQVLKGELT